MDLEVEPQEYEKEVGRSESSDRYLIGCLNLCVCLVDCTDCGKKRSEFR